MMGNSAVRFMPLGTRNHAFAAVETGLGANANAREQKPKFCRRHSIVHCFRSSYGFAGAAEATATLALVVPIKPVRLSRTPRRR